MRHIYTAPVHLEQYMSGWFRYKTCVAVGARFFNMDVSCITAFKAYSAIGCIRELHSRFSCTPCTQWRI